MTDAQETVEAVALPKVYVFANDRWGRDFVVCAIAEDGHYFGSHVCSNMSWARHDLTETPSRKEAIEAHYPAGYEVVVLPDKEAPPDEVFERHTALHAAQVSDGDGE